MTPNVMERINEINSGLEYYTIEGVNDALGEDGSYGRAGYAVINKQTGVVEHSSLVLPAVIFQAQHLDQMLSSLLDVKNTATAELFDLNTEDVVPN